eukprot:NODE_55_length_26219_cov_0.194908.p2 type:complete len:1021 gc:universal NODE_55_length_26219_cov_0.194908:4986-1924(-)
MPQLIQQKAVITYVDEFLLWPTIGPKLIERLPIKDIIVNDIRLQQLKKIRTLDLEWRVFDNSEFLKLRDISPFTVPKKFPFLNLYICKCDDLNTWQQVVKNRVISWLDIVNVVPYQQFLIIYISQSSDKKSLIFDQIKKLAKKNCCQLKFNKQFEEASWNEFFDQVKTSVIESFTQQLVHYTEELKRIEIHRRNQGWNFSKYCLIKESLARLYECMNMFNEAMIEYQEIQVAYDNSFNKSSVINPNINIIDLVNKPYQQLILEGNISDFDFKHYLLHKIILLYDFMNLPLEISTKIKSFIVDYEPDNTDTELVISWKYSLVDSVLVYLKKATTNSHLDDHSVSLLLSDYGELTWYQVLLIKQLLANPSFFDEGHCDSLLFNNILNTRNNTIEFIETSCLSAAFKYESIGMQRHAIKLKKELSICYQLLEFTDDCIGLTTSLLNHKLPNAMRISMLEMLLSCYRKINNYSEIIYTLCKLLDSSIYQANTCKSIWDSIHTTCTLNTIPIQFNMLSIFHIPKVVFNSIKELNNLVVVDVLFHNHFDFPISFINSVLTIQSMSNKKQFTLVNKSSVIDPKKDSLLQYSSLLVIPTGKYNLISNVFKCGPLLDFVVNYSNKQIIEIPPIISAFNIEFFEYVHENSIQLGVTINGPVSDVINGTFTMHLKQDSSAVVADTCTVIGNGNSYTCTLSNNTFVLPEMSNIGEFKLYFINTNIKTTCTVGCVFTFDDAIGKNHVCSSEEMYIYRNDLLMQLDAVNSYTCLSITNKCKYAVLVHECNKYTGFTILPSESYKIYFQHDLEFKMIYSYIDSFIFQKIMGYLNTFSLIPNSTRHELKCQFMDNVDFIYVANKAVVEFSDLSKMISNTNSSIPDISKHADLGVLQDFKLKLLTNDLQHCLYPCEIKTKFNQAEIPTTFIIKQLISISKCLLVDTIDVEYLIETEAMDYVANIKDTNEWIIKGMTRKLLQKSDSLKLKLQPCKVGMLMLPDCEIEHKSKLMIKPNKGYQIRVTPEVYEGLTYFSNA